MRPLLSGTAGCRYSGAGASGIATQVIAVAHSGSLTERTDAFEREQILAELKR